MLILLLILLLLAIGAFPARPYSRGYAAQGRVMTDLER